jgi:hypothetical protein
MLRAVQCRPIALVPLLLDPGVPNQGKYEERKEKKRSRNGEGSPKFIDELGGPCTLATTHRPGAQTSPCPKRKRTDQLLWVTSDHRKTLTRKYRISGWSTLSDCHSAPQPASTGFVLFQRRGCGLLFDILLSLGASRLAFFHSTFRVLGHSFSCLDFLFKPHHARLTASLCALCLPRQHLPVHHG